MRATNRKPIITYVIASTFWPHEDSEDDHRHRDGAWLLCGRYDCCCCCSFLGGLILSILFIMSIVIPFVITLSTTMTDVSSTTVSSASIDVTTATTVTVTTVTTATTITTTSATTATPTTATTITTTSATTATPTTATTITTTTATTATTTSATTRTTTTATTKTTTTKTTTSSVTTITTTSATTTTTPFDSCGQLHWNQSGATVAGGSSGSGPNQFSPAACIEIDANDTMYICDHHNYRIQMYTKGATSGVTVIDTGGNNFDHPEAFTFDKNGFSYITGHNSQRVVRYSPDFNTSVVVAGVLNSASTALDRFNDPLGMDVDGNLNLYVAERGNRRVVKWAPNATSGTLVISASTKLYGIVLSLYSSNQAYVSSEEGDAVYLWTFGASSPSVTLTQVNGTPSTLNAPRGLQYDSYGNLYVTDGGNKRVVMYCANSSVGRVVVSDNAVADLSAPYDVAFDSDLNMYVVDNNLNKVVKYTKI